MIIILHLLLLLFVVLFVVETRPLFGHSLIESLEEHLQVLFLHLSYQHPCLLIKANKPLRYVIGVAVEYVVYELQVGDVTFSDEDVLMHYLLPLGQLLALLLPVDEF